MSYPGYKNDLYEIYKSEVTGEALFSLTSKLCRSVNKKRKWQLLAQLETQTKNRYLAYLEEKKQSFSFPVSALIGGKVFGFLFALLPWTTAMKALLSGTPPLIVVFQRLMDNSDESDAEFFRYVLAHEKAIAEFASRELSGQLDTSIQPLSALLP